MNTPASGRRLAERKPLAKPIEARLHLCRGEEAAGWIVDEQDDGLGMAFGSGDVPLLATHADCCIGGPVSVSLGSRDEAPHPIPVRLAHVTRKELGQVCRAGLAFDVSRMQSEDVAHLLTLWRRFASR